MAGALLGFSMLGGEKAAEFTPNTLFVNAETRKFFVYRGRPLELMILYIDPGPETGDQRNKIKAQIDWNNWLQGTDAISTSTWTVQNTSSILTLSDASNTSTVSTVYVSSTTINSEINIRCTILTDNSTVAETESRNILVKTVRKY